MTSSSTTKRASAARRRLTESMVQTMKLPAAGTVFVWDKTLPRFGASLSAGGSRQWIVQARVTRKGKVVAARATLGAVGVEPIDKAREAARAWLRAADAGDNPIDQQKATDAAKLDASKQTMRVMVDAYLDAQRSEMRPRSLVEVKRTLDRVCDGWKDRDGRVLSKPWRDWPITTVTRDDVDDLLKKIRQNHATTAAHTLAYMRAFFAWACGEAKGLEINPAARLKAPTVNARRRFLSESEIADVWACLDAAGQPAADLFRILLLTGQRRTEGAAAMRWDELDDPKAPTLWTIPAARTKNHDEHHVPLSPVVTEIIKRQHPRPGNPFVFSATRQRAPKHRKTKSDAPSHFCGFSVAKRRVDAAVAKLRAERGDPPMPAWTLHDLRRTFTSHVNGREAIRAHVRQLRAEAREAEYRRDGVEITADLRARIERQAGDGSLSPHLAQIVLNHKAAKPGIFGVYDREKYVADTAIVLEAYARWIAQITRPADATTTATTSSNVVALRATS
jgi:integrase